MGINHPSLVYTSTSLVFWLELGSTALSFHTFIGRLRRVIMMRPLVAVGALVLLAVIAEEATTYKDDYKKDDYKKDDYYKEDSYKDDYKKESYKKDDYYKEDSYKDDYKKDSYKDDYKHESY